MPNSYPNLQCQETMPPSRCSAQNLLHEALACLDIEVHSCLAEYEYHRARVRAPGHNVFLALTRMTLGEDELVDREDVCLMVTQNRGQTG